MNIGRDGTFFFDPVARKWVDTGASGPTTIAIDNSATYDSKRDRVYFGMGGYIPEGTLPGDNFFIYDVKTNRRSKPYPQGNFPMGWSGTNSAFFNYDATNDVALLMVKLGLWTLVYAPDTNEVLSRGV